MRKKLFKRRKSSFAFTLIEVTLVLLIIIILTSVTVVYFKPNRERTDLLLSAHYLAQEIRAVEDMALSGKRISSGIPDGYGIHIADSSDSSYPNKYFLFGDRNGDHIYNSGDEIIKGPFLLGKNIEVKSLSPNSPLDIVVVPPTPKIYIGGAENQEGEITLSLKSNNQKTVSISVNKLGLIEIK